MKFKFLKIVFTGVVLSLTCLVNFANAGLIVDTDNDSFIDATTGIEWMDFGINNNLSYNYVASQLGEGGLYEGWSLPSETQVYEMWANAFIGLGAFYEQPDFYGPGGSRLYDGANIVDSVFTPVFDKMGFNLENLMGDHSHDSIGWYMKAFDVEVSSVMTVRMLDDGEVPSSNVDIANGSIGDFRRVSPDISREHSSTLLIKSDMVDIPEPTSIAIFGLGMIGLGIQRLKKRQTRHVTDLI